MMTPERFRQVEALYHTALEKPPEERAAFLAHACADDQALRRKVASLLKAHERAGELFASPLRPLPSLEDAPVPTTGAQLGPYEIIDSLGRGGMGEVYRAKDTRLGRQVAIKVLPTQFSTDRDRLRYFEQEARAASALNHPSIVTIYDIGQSQFGSYIAMELVDGPTVRALLANGPLTPKKTLNLATQVADGLAKAHAAGIVHRDLKPENLMITRDGLAKILDFGVAKLVQPTSGSEELKTSAATGTIELISILGTPGYMSPEQASGHSVDFRSDQFSLGAILYETTTGRRAFHGASELDTIYAIIREDPENIARLNPKTFPAFRWIVERCLSKAPEDRYASTFDLARELQNLRDHLPELATAEPASSPAIPQRKARNLRTFARLALTIVLVASLIGVVILGTRATGPVRHFKQLTFVNGNITGARFAADGQSVIYGMNSGANPPELFTTGLGNPESRSLHLPNSSIWSVSPSGEMAIAVGCLLNWSECIGTLARAPAPPSGGEPREIQPDVHSADWDLDGNELAIAQFSRGKDQLQYRGRVLYETSASGWIGDVRFSRRGDWIAFLDHDVLGSKGGSLRVVDLEKHTKILSTGWTSLQGLAWSKNGDEVWFSGSKGRPGPDRISAVSLLGKEREILSYPTNLQLMDISRDGRVLLRLGTARAVMMGLTQADGKVHNLSWLDFSTVADLSPDGLTTLFYEWGAATEGKPKVYLRRTDGSDAARQLADGKPLALSRTAIGCWRFDKLQHDSWCYYRLDQEMRSRFQVVKSMISLPGRSFLEIQNESFSRRKNLGIGGAHTYKVYRAGLPNLSRRTGTSEPQSLLMEDVSLSPDHSAGFTTTV